MKTPNWSNSVDPKGGLVQEAIENSPYRGIFEKALTAFCEKANRHERVNVMWWYPPLVYIEVVDDRRAYPQRCRALISFDLSNGLFYSELSKTRHALARWGWGEFLDRLAQTKIWRMK